MKCKVELYERGRDLTFEDWINQMETYFTVEQVPFKALVGFMLMKIVSKHLKGIKNIRTLSTWRFEKSCLKFSKNPIWQLPTFEHLQQ